MTYVIDEKQRRPKGPAIRLSEAWQARVDAELEERGMTRLDLADAIGATSGAMTNLLTPGRQVTSRLVQPVCDHLKIPLPQYIDERDAEAIRLLRQLRDQDHLAYEQVLAKIRRHLDE